MVYFVLKVDIKHFFEKGGNNLSYSGLQKDTNLRKESSSLRSSNIQTGAAHYSLRMWVCDLHTKFDVQFYCCLFVFLTAHYFFQKSISDQYAQL